MLQIYRASAGSGKTFTLAYEYIKMLLGVKNPETGQYELNRTLNDRHRGILAVTFTNKATEEMKQRIIHELAVLGEMEPGWGKPSPYLKSLCSELNCTPEQLRPAAAKALRCLLFDFNFFNVSTIDSFFQIVLRTFAREADIDGNYEVDLDNKRAIGYGVHELFDSLTSDGNSSQTRRMVHWITQHLLGELANGRSVRLFDRSGSIHGDIVRFIDTVSNDLFVVYFEQMMVYLSKPELLQQFVEKLNDSEDSILNTTRESCSEALKIISERGYDNGKLKVSSNLLKQLTRCASSGEETGTAKTADKVAADLMEAYGKPLAKYLSENPDTRLDDAIAEACQAIVGGKTQLRLIRDAKSSLFILGLLERVYYHIDKYRAENNAILLSDTNSILREIIGEEDAPFVYERVGLWIRHFLIDEFQDTSRLQWENMRPLLREGLSSGDDSLIIGDEKQCIYRFRDSDPTLLQHRVTDEFPKESCQHPNNKDISTNWRSSAVVVNFNNALFRTLAQQSGFEEIYKNVEQKVAPDSDLERGYVKIAQIDSEKREDYQETSLRLMTEDISAQLRAGYKPSDICVLARKNTDASLVINHLMGVIASKREEFKGVSVISDDSMAIDSAPVVKLVLSVMRYMAIPSIDESVGAEAVKSRRDKRREAARLINSYQYLMSTGADSETALATAISDVSATASERIDRIADSMICFNVPSLVERIIEQYVAPEVASEQNMHLSAFVDVVIDFCSRGTADLQTFLSWWDDEGHRSKISAPADENAIRVMTIHKSKGLEFKCVHIPFVDWDVVKFRNSVWFVTNGSFVNVDPAFVPPILPLKPSAYMAETQFAEQYNQMVRETQLDELNATYVAFTRAVDQLCVNYPATNSGCGKINGLLDGAFGELEFSSCSGNNVDNQCDMVNVMVRTVGTPTIPLPDKKKSKTALQPRGSEMMMPYATSSRDDLWSALDIERYLDYGLARDRGTVLHDVLAHVLHATDLEHAVAMCSYRGRLPKEMASEVMEHLSSQLQRPEVESWFAGFKRVLRERSLILKSGEVSRPDRVVWTSSGTVDVIDYKFGKEHPKAYANQVKAYITALENMGCEHVRGFIWYLDSGKIVPVQ